MFPIRVMVETVQDHECTNCSSSGDVLADSYAIVSGGTPLSQLVDTVLAALGFQQLAYGSKGLIQLKNWKPLSFEQITENPESTVESLLKDLSNHLTLKILTKQADTAVRDCVSDLKGRLLKAALNRNPQILTTLKNPQLKDFVTRLVQGETQSLQVTSEQIQGFNTWLEEVNKSRPHPGSPNGLNGSLGGGPYQPTTTRFNQLLEVPKLQRWFQENPNPSRSKLIQLMQILNGSNFRRHNSKITYQQICNWFSNARAQQRQVVQQKRPLAGSAETIPSVFDPSHLRDISLDINELLRQQREQQQQSAGSGDSGIDMEPQEAQDPFHSAYMKTEEDPEDDCTSMPVDSTQDSGAEGLSGGGLLLSNYPPPMSSASSLTPPRSVSALSVSPDNTGGGVNGVGEKVSNGPSLGGAGGLNMSMTSRSRLMFDPLTELPLLEKWFEENPHPSWIQIDQYTEQLNTMAYRHTYPAVSTHNVKIWFKNRRAKCKRLQGHSDSQLAVRI